MTRHVKRTAWVTLTRCRACVPPATTKPSGTPLDKQAKLFFRFSRGSVFGDVLENRHPAADSKNPIFEGDRK